ncbi:related to Acyl-protein thioesterase 1 [Saccharomycodes ludwigii]|uniref:Acyl-protein thioesterase 1 n=1 Tax=Saccharomycodes ludwigii TaxID=36035 RepID=A0A376B449_9ASCO|nr:related to Acyl-protein thioesterase 1 [Saccharomycodes ludwigii]
MTSRLVRIPSLVTPASSTLIFLHGLGDSGDGWVSLARYLQVEFPKIFNKTQFVFPTAPVINVTVNNNFPMNAWFDLYEFGSSGNFNFESIENQYPKRDTEGFIKSLDYINELIDEQVNKYGIDPSKIVIGGFSQGAALSLAISLTAKKKIGGILSLSGFPVLPIPKAKTLLSDSGAVNLNTPTFHGHGDVDPVIPLMLARYSKEYYVHQVGSLTNYTLREYNGMAHSTCDEELKDIADFLQKVYQD